MSDYAEKYAAVVRYSHSDTVREIASQMTHAEWRGNDDEHLLPYEDHPDWTRRLVLADAVQDQGRDEEAELLRDLSKPIHHDGETFKPGVVRYRSAAYDDSEHGGDFMDYIRDSDSSTALNEAVGSYDYGSGLLYKQPTHGSSDYHYSEGPYTLAWNPRLGYWGLDEQHILPEEHAHHNVRLEGNRGTLHVPEYDNRTR